MGIRDKEPWRQVRAFLTEQGRGSRWRNSPGEVVRLVAYLGTPASELAQIMSTDVQVVISAADGRQALTPTELQRLSAWLSASWWQHLWRSGHRDAASEDALRDAVIYSSGLPWVPYEWSRDITIAVASLGDKGQ